MKELVLSALTVFNVNVCDTTNISPGTITVSPYGAVAYQIDEQCALSGIVPAGGPINVLNAEGNDEFLGIVYGRPSHFIKGENAIDGREVRQSLGVDYLHHDIIRTSWGAYMAIGAKRHGDSKDDLIVEFDENGLISSFSLNTMIFGDPSGAIDLGAPFKPENWLHTNSIDEKNGKILVSTRNINELQIIDWKNKQLKQSFGSETLSLQHYARYQADGSILVFDNGAKKKQSGIARYSGDGELIEYIDLPFYAPAYGSVQQLENGNWLVIDGPDGRVYELGPKGEAVYMDIEYQVKDWVPFHDRYMSILYRAVKH